MTSASDGESDKQILLGRDDSLVRDVGRSLVEHGLRDGASLFEPARKAWSSATVDELYRLYNEHPDPGTDSFLVKLQRQLQGASDETILLAAELLTLHALPLGNFGQAKKGARIGEVLSWMRSPVAIPPRVDAAFGQHSWGGGTGAHTMIWKWLQDAVAFTQAWWQLSETQRSQALNDPWAWEGVVHQFPAIASLREELLYLAFPGYFLPIINVQHKKAIRDAFGHLMQSHTRNLDHDLYLITLALQRQTGDPVDYYSAPFVHEWRAKPEPTAEQRAWLVRPRPGGQALVERWKREGFVSLAGTHLGDVAPGTELAQVREAVEAGYQHLDYAQRIALAREYYTFLSRMAEGHIVTTVIGNKLSAGVITGEPVYDPAATDTRLRRSVTWQETEPVGVDELPAPLPAELDQQGTVVDLTRGIDVLSQMLGAEPPESLSTASVAEAAAAISTVPVLAAATPALAERVHMPLAWLQEVIDVLQERQQIVFYGPPGTGKTFLAQEIARHVAERDAVRFVQFHPSYAYEDFFEGFRPVSGQDGSVGFTLTAGPLRSLASDAASNPGEPYVLIVDEINRANLAKVFGELYFLLEYRDAKIGLQYSPDKAFSLPRNVFFIGTMNTADRSIALVDAAIRRRFAFIELHPDEPPVRDLLANWLAASHKTADERAELLQALNQVIGEEDRDFKIGPSYLMRPEAESPGGLERVWRYDLLPLLEEHYYGRLTRSQVHAQFGLEATRARLAQAEADAAMEPYDPESAGQ